jgi:5-formyltetrahydrofolate cyclo-ligase
MRQNTGQPENKPKSWLRRELRSCRNSLSSSQRTGYDAAIARHLLQLVQSRDALSIAGYWPFNGEPDITPVYRKLLPENRQLALPVISTDGCHDMQFHSWSEESEVAVNRYGILEPSKTEPVPLSSLDMLLIPLVGYDRYGNRLGMGSGYYDRCLESLRDLPSPLRVGIAYSLQEVDLVDKENWDIPLHGVVNEHGWRTFENTKPLNDYAEE